MIIDREDVTIDFDNNASNKNDLLKEIAIDIKLKGFVDDENELYKTLLNREVQSSTGFGNGIALPHAQGDYKFESKIFLYRIKNKMNFDSIDEKSVNTLIIILVNESKKQGEHMKVLSSLARLLMNQNFIDVIKDEKNVDSLTKYINEKVGGISEC